MAVVAWVEDRRDSQSVLAVRVAPDGSVTPPVSVGGAAAVPPVAVAAFAEKSILLFADDRTRMREVYGLWLDADGNPSGSPRRLSDAGRRDPGRGQRIGLDLIEGGARDPALLADGARAIAAWDMPQPPRNQVFLSRWPVGADVPPDPTMVSSGPSDTRSPSLARAGSDIGVAYCVGVPGRYEVMFTTLDARSGGPGRTRRVAETPWGPCAPALESVGDAFVLAWVGGDEHEGKVLVAGVSADADATPPQELGPIALRPPRSQIDRLVSAAGTSEGVIVAWAGPKRGGGAELRAALVGTAGAVLAPARTVVETTRYPADLSLAARGADALVAWHDTGPGDGDVEDIYLARISCKEIRP